MSSNSQALSQSTHCLATDQTGKQQLLVGPAQATRNRRPDNGRPLRFVILTTLKQKPSAGSRRKRKVPPRTALKPVPDAHEWDMSSSPFVGVGNPGNDDLNSFPIKNSRTVTIAIDFLTKHMMLGRSKLSYDNNAHTVHLPILKLSMQYEYLFECVVAMALAYRETDTSVDLKLTSDIAYHWGRSIASLRKQLGKPGAYADDAAILTTIFLGDLATKYGTSAEVTAHSAALENMIMMRGGVEKLDQKGLLKAMIDYGSTIGDLPGITKEDELPIHADSSLPLLQPDPQWPADPPITLTYLNHPFPSEVCSLIAGLPEGFRELALDRHLSIEVIGLIDLTQRQLFPPDARILRLEDHCPANIIMQAKRYLRVSTRLTESLVCLSLMLISMRSFCYRFSPQLYLFPKKLWVLARQRGRAEASLEQHHHFIWTVLLTAGACKCQPLVKYVDPLLVQIFDSAQPAGTTANESLRDWPKVKSIMKKFLWSRDLLLEWQDVWQLNMRVSEASAPQESQPQS